jgi:HK97 family phage portal protein
MPERGSSRHVGMIRPRQDRAALPEPGPLGQPERVNIDPNDNPQTGSVGPNVPVGGDPSAQFGDEGGFGALHVAYDPRLSPVPWAGWPVDFGIPVQAGVGMGANVSDIVFACIDLNARVTANMPVYVTKYGVRQPNPLWVLNPQPELYHSWNQFWETCWWSYQAAGEAFIHCDTRYADGRPQSFHAIDPWLVDPQLSADGLRTFWINGVDATDDILHIPYRLVDTVARGIGPLEYAGEHLRAARALTRYGANLANNGGVPYAVLQHKYKLSAEQSASMRQQWIVASLNRMGAPAVLDSDTQFKELQVNPKDMALRELQDHSESRIAVLLGVPPFLVGLPAGGDSLTYSSSVSLFDYHWRSMLDPKSSLIVAALSGWALPLHTDLRINPTEYTRESAAVRGQFYQFMFNIVDPVTGARAMTVDEIREAEQFAPSPAAYAAAVAAEVVA